MNQFFLGCSSLNLLPDISNWNTGKVLDVREMFYGCSSLLSLPDISKSNTKNVKNITMLFLSLLSSFFYFIK